MLASVLMVQAVVSMPPPASGPVLPAPVPSRLSLPKRCAPDASAVDVTVCGSRSASERYRLTPLSDRYEEAPIRAAFKLSDTTTAAVVAQQQDYGSGFVAKRVSLDFRFLFGGKKKR